jgi:hypothetical protein
MSHSVTTGDSVFLVWIRSVMYDDSYDSESNMQEKVLQAGNAKPIVLGVFSTLAYAKICLLKNGVEDHQIVEIIQTRLDDPDHLFSSVVQTHRKRHRIVVDSSSSNSTSNDGSSSDGGGSDGEALD